MKKNYILYVCAAAALMFASCQKEGPATQNSPAEPDSMEVITATTIQTKTMTQDGVNVLWEKGDGILLACQPDPAQQPVTCSYTTTLTQPNSTAVFVMDAGQQNQPTLINDKYVAVYPAALNYSLWSKYGFVTLAADKNQVVENGGWDPNSALMLAVSENSEFTFKHVVSYIKFQVDANTTPFKKVLVSSLDSSQEIISRISVYFNGDPHAFVTGKSQCSKVVSFANSNNSNFAPGTYYIAVNPDTYAEGLKITFENGTNVCEITTPANVVMTPGDVADLGTIGTLKFPSVSDKLGTLYSENGVSGVIFWVDENQTNAGKIVSGAGTQVTWGTASTYTWAPDIDTDNGVANHEYVLNVEGSSAEAYPAVYYCKNLGDGWRLPTVNELNALAKTYYGIVGEPEAEGTYYTTEPYMTNAAAFDAVLAQIATDDPNTEYDETKIAMSSNSWYWTGQGSSNLKIQRVKFAQKYAVGAAGATNANFVRCVREVTLN